MARKNQYTDTEIRHDGGAETFLARQGEALLHWAAPKVEAARAWGEVGAAFGQVGGSYAAEEGRRVAAGARSDYGPLVKKGAERASGAADLLTGRVSSLAPVVTSGLAAVAPLLHAQSGTRGLLSSLQDQAARFGEDLKKDAAQARKDAGRRAGKSRRKAGRKAQQVRRDGRRAGRTAEALGFLTGERADRARDTALQGGLTVAGLLMAAATALQEQGEKAAPRLQDRLSEAREYAALRREEFAPVAAARLADVAGTARRGAHELTVPASVEQALIALTGDKKIVAKTRKAAERYTGRTEKDLKRAARTADREERSGGRGWILSGMALAASGAGYAVWRLTKPVQDPWAAPVPGPITANIPVVQHGEGGSDPYAMQRKALSEATGGRETLTVETTPAVNRNPMVADAEASPQGELPNIR